jgi:hypothetical protein
MDITHTAQLHMHSDLIDLQAVACATECLFRLEGLMGASRLGRTFLGMEVLSLPAKY